MFFRSTPGLVEAYVYLLIRFLLSAHFEAVAEKRPRTSG
jgi:hypothetical protein